MPFTKKPDIDFKINEGKIVLSKEFVAAHSKRFKKITGSRFASVLNFNSFSSPVKTWAMMVGIYKEDMDPMLANAGNVIEPKIREYVELKTKTKYLEYDVFKIKWDAFKENKIFGGIPDGEPVNENNEFLYPQKPMLEIKTSSIDKFVYKKEGNVFILQKDAKGYPLVKTKNLKHDSWFDVDKNVQIPPSYAFQLGLYCYLRGINTGIFAIAFLEQEDYVKPQKFVASKREIQIVDFNVDLNEMKKWIEYATNWYNEYIVKGVSPKMTDNDLEWYKIELESK